MTGNLLIDRIAVDWGEMPVMVSFSYGPQSIFPFTIVRISAGGVEGVGEVLIHPNRFFEAFLPSLAGCDARSLDDLLPSTSNDEDRILCEAVSIALHDLVGKLSGQPVHALLGGACNRRVPLMPCIFPESPEDAGQKAHHFFSLGYTRIKTKLIGRLEEDLERVRSIRSVAPGDIELQGDANEGYKTLPGAQRAIEELGAAGLDIFEDPLEGDVEAYRELRKTEGAAIMVDKLARRTGDLTAVLRGHAADMINIHPDQAGSLTRVLQHARLAQNFDLPVRIGGTGYTGVGTAAYQHLAAVLTPGEPCGELGGIVDHGMPASTVKKPLAIEGNEVLLTDSPGLGVELDPETLAGYGMGHREWDR